MQGVKPRQHHLSTQAAAGVVGDRLCPEQAVVCKQQAEPWCRAPCLHALLPSQASLQL